MNTGDFLTDQLINISKAGAYEAIITYYKRLKTENKNLRDVIDHLAKTLVRIGDDDIKRYAREILSLNNEKI